MGRRIARHGALATSLAVAAVALGCAPKAELLDAPVAREIEEGVRRGGQTFDHSRLDRLLAAHVRSERGRVDYEGLRRDRAELDAYLERVAAADLDALSAPELKALLVNAYNAYTLELIVENLDGLESIRDLPDPWGGARYVLGGHTVSLDDIEHGLLRPIFKDPRIHFAVNCASVGCPPLRAGAYTGAGIESQLDEAARRTLGDARYARWESGALHLTQIMNWYGEDFTKKGWSPTTRTVPGFVARYAPDELARELSGEPTVTWLDYDWSLNAAR